MSGQRYAVWDTATGEIIRYGACPRAAFDLQATKPGQAVAESFAGVTDQTHRVDIATGEIVPKP